MLAIFSILREIAVFVYPSALLFFPRLAENKPYELLPSDGALLEIPVEKVEVSSMTSFHRQPRVETVHSDSEDQREAKHSILISVERRTRFEESSWRSQEVIVMLNLTQGIKDTDGVSTSEAPCL